MDREAFKEALLHVMERKEHWAWPGFTGGMVPAELLHVHLEQEWEVYVRDFPVMVGRAYVQCPIAEVRRDLAENLYEEETGGLVAGRPHPELFLEYPRGLGMDLSRFERVQLLPAAKAYRAAIDGATEGQGWSRAAAVTTIFLEGTKYDRGELEDAPKRPAPPLSEHPLVKHYGLPLEHLALTKAHREVEGSHRADAWAMMLDQVPAAHREGVIESMELVLERWQGYRDAVAETCGLTRGEDGAPRLASAA